MKGIKLIKKISSNKVVKYLLTRYLTYFLQFLTSIVIAVKLGPFYFGIWAFITLLINYFSIIDFGIANAIQVLLVQNKDNELKEKNYVLNSFFLIGVLGLFISLVALYQYFIGISFLDKYKVDNHFYIICLIAILANFNFLMMNIYRVKNSLFHLSFYQSIIPVLTFVLMFFATGETLLYILLWAYVLGNLLSLLVFFLGKKVSMKGKINLEDSYAVLNKGFFLFIKNMSFYLVVVSIRSLISIFYTVEEFGFFSFSFTLSNSILFFLQALTFVVNPKLISKLKETDYHNTKSTIDTIRRSYVSLAFGLIFLALVIYPFFLNLIPKYQETFVSFCFTSLTIVLYTNSFGYSTFLVAQNKERLVSFISFICLLINIGLALFLVLYLKVSYNYVIVATIITYSLYSYLCVTAGKKIMGISDGFLKNFEDCFSYKLLLPYLIAILFVVFGFKEYLIVPFLVYVVLNVNSLKLIFEKFKMLLNKPEVINL